MNVNAEYSEVMFAFGNFFDGAPCASLRSSDVDVLLQAVVVDGMRNLRPFDRQVLRLRYMEGMSREEIARSLGCDTEDVVLTESAAREALRAAIAG